MIDNNVMNVKSRQVLSWGLMVGKLAQRISEPNFVKLWNIRIIAGKRFPVGRVRDIFQINYNFPGKLFDVFLYFSQNISLAFSEIYNKYLSKLDLSLVAKRSS